jgi:hypothetical protein
LKIKDRWISALHASIVHKASLPATDNLCDDLAQG